MAGAAAVGTVAVALLFTAYPALSWDPWPDAYIFVGTVVDAGPDYFTVSLIPTTLDLTTLGHKQPGDPVNLEVDVIAKYVERLLGSQGAAQ